MSAINNMIRCRSQPDLSVGEPNSARDGITIIEVLVVAAICSFLCALLLPAISAAREGARRKQCADYLRQMGVACHSHESARRTFPYTSIGYKDTQSGVWYPTVSPHARLLPYLEAETVFAQISFNDWPINTSPGPPISNVNGKAMKETLAVFLCPSDRPRPGATNYRACLGPGVDVFPLSLAPSCGDPGNCTGAFVNGRGVSAAEFTDGLSNTVMFSEKLIGSGAGGGYDPWSDYLVSSASICTADEARAQCAALAGSPGPYDRFAGTTWLFGGWRQTWYNHVLPPNAGTPDCNEGAISFGGGRGIYTARSNHSGGVNVAMADGSARFVADRIDATVWRALATREGREALDLSF